MPMAFPDAMLVPEKRMFFLSWLTALGSGMGSVCLMTDTDSPVRMDWSTRRVVDWIFTSRMSAGTLSPTDTSTKSPGTISLARIFCTPCLLARSTLPISGSYSFRASMALSALRSCQTPTTALAIRMRRMTKGSTKAVMESSCSSNSARTNEITAANNKIFTRRSSNCSSISCHKGLPSSAGSSLGPYLSWSFLTWDSESPRSGSVPK
uniref:Putative secreted protein n=1 Tax=Ixodes ricinus TaxID=34613 RepID=A0A6B0V2Y3_IXORI